MGSKINPIFIHVCHQEISSDGSVQFRLLKIGGVYLAIITHLQVGRSDESMLAFESEVDAYRHLSEKGALFHKKPDKNW